MPNKQLRKEVEAVKNWKCTEDGCNVSFTSGKLRLVKYFDIPAGNEGVYGPYYQLYVADREVVDGYGFFTYFFGWVRRLFKRLESAHA